ncbi:hypothetical protein C446_13039 [Halobiforma nitratireducens JCM 10879]|uniref:Uncharacterized protein n=1 Tax=Halobiforma nitratireducens JCM 10879 TaxID=1227454 RepID=M0LS46_9EURY|nr:hypothetical protein C446_13039 [Halobiforma nitratireducens JCM 10879]
MGLRTRLPIPRDQVGPTGAEMAGEPFPDPSTTAIDTLSPTVCCSRSSHPDGSIGRRVGYCQSLPERPDTGSRSLG